MYIIEMGGAFVNIEAFECKIFVWNIMTLLILKLFYEDKEVWEIYG